MTDLNLYYVLDADGEPKPASTEEWVTQYGDNVPARVGMDKVGEWEISTVFLGINCSFGEGPPILWETMIFGPEPWDCWQRRYSTAEDALAGHALAVGMVMAASPSPFFSEIALQP